MKKKVVLLLMFILSMQIIEISSYESLISTEMIPLENQILSKDTIIIKFRNYHGKRQYRRWNDTKKCWADSKWIDAP